MLIQFALSNFRSFQARVELNMRAGTSVPRPGPRAELPQRLSVLRCASVYGANASGKSNLVRALKFAKDFITNGPASKEALIRTEPFRLSKTSLEATTCFEFYLLSEGVIYGYTFEVLPQRVVFERLCRLDPVTLEEELLFERHDKSFEFSSALKSELDDANFLGYVAQGTKANQLFVHEAHERSVPFVEPVYRWFSRTLTIIEAGAQFLMLEELAEDDKQFRSHLRQVLGWADTGIVDLEMKVHRLDERVKEEIDDLLNDPKTRALIERLRPVGNRRRAIKRGESGEMDVLSLVPHHRGEEDSIPFDLADESDGTLRLMDLAPMLYFAQELNDIVFVVDELDRSLHTLLAQELVRRFVEIRPAAGAPTTQLIFTTHDTNLLDCTLLGHDSVWFTEKDPRGASSLYSLAEFSPDQLNELSGGLERGYLKGRFGAIPFLGDPGRLKWLSNQKEGQ